MKAVPDTVYQLKVQLMGIQPEIWRRVLLSGRTTLDRVHRVIQVAMGWQNRHLHQFVSGERIYGEPNPDFDNDWEPESDVAISALLSQPGQSLVYEYDFGDGWEHQVTLEQVLAGAGDRILPVCLDGQRACPPEDVGGPHGYERFLRAYLDSKHAEHGEMRDWAGEGFEPERFLIESVNSVLSAN
jgi:hypothetical protein